MPSKLTSNKAIAFYLVAAMLGAGVGALIGRKLSEKFEKETYVDYYVEEFERTMKEMNPEEPPVSDWMKEEFDKMADHSSEIDPESVKANPTPKGKKKGQHPEPEEKDYSKISKRDQVKQSIADVARKYAIKDDVPLTDDPDSPIRIISLEEYVNGEPSQQQRDLTYFESDDTLADEDEKIITDPDALIGSEALVSFGKLSSDPDIVYVRNTKTGEDFEVTRLQQSYSVVVLGIVPEKPKARTKRVKQMPDESDE